MKRAAADQKRLQQLARQVTRGATQTEAVLLNLARALASMYDMRLVPGVTVDRRQVESSARPGPAMTLDAGAVAPDEHGAAAGV